MKNNYLTSTDEKKKVLSPKKIIKIKNFQNSKVVIDNLNEKNNFELKWEKINYTLKKEEKKILKNINGRARSGRILGIIGPSGGGKTSLLDILYGKIKKNNNNRIEKNLFLNKKKIKSIKKISTYLEKEPLLYDYLTIEENIKFSADINISKISSIKKKQKIKRIIKNFGLTRVKNTKINTIFGEKVSGGEKQRTYLASQLIILKKIIFLDEPTTGLDSKSSLKIIEGLKNITVENNLICILTIHKPIPEVFVNLDDICVLSEGSVIFFGERESFFGYLKNQLDLELPRFYSPIEFFLDFVNVDFKIESEKRKIIDFFKIKWEKEEEKDFKSLLVIKAFKENNNKELTDDEKLAKKNNINKIKDLTNKNHTKNLEEKEIQETKEYNNKEDNNNEGKEIKEFKENNNKDDNNNEELIYDEKLFKKNKINEIKDKNFKKELKEKDLKEKDLKEKELEKKKEKQKKSQYIKITNSITATKTIVKKKSKFPRSFYTQIKILTKRNFKLAYRNPILYMSRLIIHIILAFLLSSCFYKVKNDQRDIHDKFSFLFFSAFFPGIFASITIIPLIKEKKIFKREYTNKSYSIFSFIISKYIIIMLSLFIINLLYTLILYFLSNLQKNFFKGFIFFLAEYIFLLVVETFHFFIISISSKIEIILTLSLFVNTLFAISLGFFKKLIYMPKFFLFFHYLSFEKYIYEILIKNEFDDLFFNCDSFFGNCLCYFERENLNECKMSSYDVLEDYGYNEISIFWWFGILGVMFFIYLLLGMVILKKSVK